MFVNNYLISCLNNHSCPIHWTSEASQTTDSITLKEISFLNFSPFKTNVFLFQAVINSTITPNMTFTKTSQKFGQWSDIRANTVYGLGFASEPELNKVCFIISCIEHPYIDVLLLLKFLPDASIISHVSLSNRYIFCY